MESRISTDMETSMMTQLKGKAKARTQACMALSPPPSMSKRVRPDSMLPHSNFILLLGSRSPSVVIMAIVKHAESAEVTKKVNKSRIEIPAV